MVMYVDINKNKFPKFNGNFSDKNTAFGGNGKWQDVLYLLANPGVKSEDKVFYDRPVGECKYPENSINVDLSDEELAQRKAQWQPRQPKITTGYLARYASLVTSGNRGAVLEVK